LLSSDTSINSQRNKDKMSSKGEKHKSYGFSSLFVSVFIVAVGVSSWKTFQYSQNISEVKRALQESLVIDIDGSETNAMNLSLSSNLTFSSNLTNSSNETFLEYLEDPMLLEDTYVKDGYEESNMDQYEMVIETMTPSFGLIKFELPEDSPESVIGLLLRLKVSNVHSCSTLGLRVRKLSYFNSWYEQNATYCTAESLLDSSTIVGGVDIFQPAPIEGLDRIGNSDFYMSKDLLSWSDHLEQAQSFGMTLASVHSQDEQKLIFEFMSSEQNSDSYGVWTGGKRNYYNPLQWEWADGSEFHYVNWAPGQPSNNGMEHPFDQDRLMLGGTGFWPKGVWHDKQGAHKRYALYSWTQEVSSIVFLKSTTIH